jgi:hypothetical protein
MVVHDGCITNLVLACHTDAGHADLLVIQLGAQSFLCVIGTEPPQISSVTEGRRLTIYNGQPYRLVRTPPNNDTVVARESKLCTPIAACARLTPDAR